AVTTDLRAGSDCLFTLELFSSGADRVRRMITECRNTVVFGGNNPQINARECVDRTHIELPEKVKQLMDTALSLNENAVLFLVSGYPFALDSRYSSVLHISHAGPALGAAVSKTLFGEVSPAGRCPVTWYKSDKELCDIRDYNIIRTKTTYLYYDREPLFPFGHGLSYTGFRYGRPKADKLCYSAGDTVTVTLEVENVGMCSSDEVVQLYVAAPRVAKKLPRKQLKAFKRVHIQKGKKAAVSLSFSTDSLGFWDVNTGESTLFGGTYEIQIGASSEDIRRTLDITVAAPEYAGVDVTKPVPAALSDDYAGVTFESDAALNEYALINDWQSYISYDGCRMGGKKHIEIIAANPCSGTRITVICAETGALIAEAEIPATGAFDAFTTITAEAQPMDGVRTLRFTTGGTIALKSFRFF
ncbi:MAG: glycoside hydrolase family 3 C-terminal domain-containing protein, partial [Oscillospiraceae bacterium]